MERFFFQAVCWLVELRRGRTEYGFLFSGPLFFPRHWCVDHPGKLFRCWSRNDAGHRLSGRPSRSVHAAGP